MAVAVSAVLALAGLSACDSVQSDAAGVAAGLESLPSVVGASSSGNGMQLNRDAESRVSVQIAAASSRPEIEAVVSAWFRASGDLPKTSLALTMPATELEGDNGLTIARSGYAEADLPAVVASWYSLTEAYARVTSDVQSVSSPGAPYGVTRIVDAGVAAPSGLARVVDELRALGADPGMTWWLQSVPDVDAATSSITAFSRNELPSDDLVALLVGFDDAYARAGSVGGMNLEVASNYDGVYQVTANINADALRDVAEADVVGRLEESDAWPVVRSIASAVDPAAAVDVTFSILHHDAFAELDTTDCSKQSYAQYATLGPVVWSEWAGSSGAPCE